MKKRYTMHDAFRAEVCKRGCKGGILKRGKHEAFCACYAGREASSRYAKNWPQAKEA